MKSLLPLELKQITDHQHLECEIKFPSGKNCSKPGYLYAVMRGFKTGKDKIIERDSGINEFTIAVCDDHANLLLQEFQNLTLRKSFAG